MTMVRERLSHLQRRILAWLGAEAQHTQGTMAGWAVAIVGTLALTFLFFCFLCYVLGLTKPEAITTAVRLSRLKRCILAWLVTEDQRTRGTMATSHEDLVRALEALGFDKGNVSTSLKGLAAKGLVTITRTLGGKAEAVDLTAEGRNRAAPLTASCEQGYNLMKIHGLALTRAVLLLALASPALAGPVRCTTYEEKTLGRLQTLCDDGTRAVSTWSPTLQRWQSTVTPPPGQTCTGQMNSRTQQVEVRCR
jgi:DNA-binding MarR family transcriptional regulator